MNLIIETTRKCNMACQHCLRGKAEPLVLDPELQEIFFRQLNIAGIDDLSIAFSGGEPSLVPQVMQDTLFLLQKFSISLSHFYIATNGLDIPENFAIQCLRLFNYADEKDICHVDVSNDYYHAEEGQYNTTLLDGLSFFGRKHDKEATYDFPCLNEGNYEENYNDSQRYPQATSIATTEDAHDADIYLNCHGNIINGCDWSYSSQDEHIICHASNFANWYNNLTPRED